MAKEILITDAALVLQGGGTRGAFVSGALDVLMENGIYFGYVIGTSAGALNMVNYVSKDIGRSRIILTQTMHDPKFVSVRNWLHGRGMFNFPYLFHTVPKTSVPFNAKAFNESPIRALAATACLETGKPEYFEKGKTKDFYKAVAASSSLPLIAKPVRIDEKHYLDGGIGAAIPFRKPLEDGFKKIVLIETRQPGFRKSKKTSHKLLSRILYRKYPNFVKAYKTRHDDYNADMEELDRIHEEGKVFRIRPKDAPNVKMVEKDQDKLEELYQKGREAMTENLAAMLAYLEMNHE